MERCPLCTAIRSSRPTNGERREEGVGRRSGRLIKRSSIIVQLCRLINPLAIMLPLLSSLYVALFLSLSLPFLYPSAISIGRMFAPRVLGTYRSSCFFLPRSRNLCGRRSRTLSASSLTYECRRAHAAMLRPSIDVISLVGSDNYILESKDCYPAAPFFLPMR